MHPKWQVRRQPFGFVIHRRSPLVNYGGRACLAFPIAHPTNRAAYPGGLLSEEPALGEASKQDWSRAQLRKAVKKDLFHSQQISDSSAALKRDLRPMYVYKAIVQSVVDGDTLLVRIDLGFNVWVDQRIRFRGINTAELSSSDAESKALAEKARVFVEEKLKDIPFIVIKTYKTDSYGRYVADVFYHPTISKKEAVAVEGFFLNEELLKSGLAKLLL